ncbi:MAG: hypothetical protein DRP58_13090, partial [Spirochaetes bacterium]
PIGGLLPTATTVVAIDADDDSTYDLFRSLDPTNTAYFDSIDKVDKDGNKLRSGTILYKGHETIPPSFRATNGSALDFYNGTGMVFLPTTKNSTKTTWLESDDGKLYNHKEELVVIKDMPQVVKDLLSIIKLKPPIEQGVGKTATNSNSKGFMGRKLANYDLSAEKYHPELTKYLTPKEYRSPLYVKQGHLHPNDIPTGASGHIYLFKIASILAGDNTVDKELFRDTLYYFNDLWDNPMPTKTLEKTIIVPILRGQLNPQGDSYWQYDEEWENAQGYRVTAKRNYEQLEVFYDSSKKQYYIHSLENDTVQAIGDITTLTKYLRGAVGTVDQKLIYDEANDIHTHSLPTQDFGYFNDSQEFNLFKASESLSILNEPTQWADDYKLPNEFIDYMENFIPSEEQRVYLLRFIRTKLTTFGYSPVVPYIIGVQGSGKNTIMTVLQNILGGSQYVKTDVGGEQFLEKYNAWLMDTYFIQLNELGDTLTSQNDKRKAQGILKNYTGSKEFECRAMHTDPFTYPQTATFIMTANHSPLSIEDNDRRLYYISTPNTFDFSPQCLASDPVTVYEAIMAQTKDIAYYLATEFTNLQKKDYVRAPEAEGKMAMIFESLNSSTKMAWALQGGHFDMLMEWLIDPLELFNADVTNDKVWLIHIVKAYEHHSATEDAERVIKLAMKAQGFKLHFGSYMGKTNMGYYVVPHISDYDGCSTPIDSDAEDIELESTIRS